MVVIDDEQVNREALTEEGTTYTLYLYESLADARKELMFDQQ